MWTNSGITISVYQYISISLLIATENLLINWSSVFLLYFLPRHPLTLWHSWQPPPHKKLFDTGLDWWYLTQQEWRFLIAICQFMFWLWSAPPPTPGPGKHRHCPHCQPSYFLHFVSFLNSDQTCLYSGFMPWPGQDLLSHNFAKFDNSCLWWRQSKSVLSLSWPVIIILVLCVAIGTLNITYLTWYTATKPHGCYHTAVKITLVTISPLLRTEQLL